MSKRAILYARVSTDDQADKGYSLPSQLDLCRAYADRMGYSVVEQLREDHSGATPIAERPAGRTLAAMLEARTADAVIVYQVDRLSRKLGDLINTVEHWLRLGVEVHTCDVGKIESENDIVLVIKGWQGTDEGKKIVERTSRGRNSKARTGKPVGAGFAPYGFAKVYDMPPPPAKPKVIAFEIVKDEAETILRIFRWYVWGENHVHLSVHEMCRRLQAAGVPIPSENHFWGECRSVWSPTIIYKILGSELYVGVWHWGKNIGKGGRRGRRAKHEQIAVEVPAIVPRDLWEAAQAKREYNVLMSKRRATHEYLLRGMVKCSCGRTMIGRFRADVHTPDPRYYRCSTETDTWKERRCGQRRIPAPEVEAEVWNFAYNVMRDAMKYEDLLRQAQQEEFDAVDPKRAELETAERQLADCEREVASCASVLVKARGAVGEALEKKMHEVNDRHAELLKHRDELKAQVETRSLTDEAVDAALHFREDVIEGLDNPTPEMRRWFLETLGAEVNVKDSTLSVTLRVESSPLPCLIS